MNFRIKHPEAFKQPKPEYGDPYKSEEMSLGNGLVFTGMYTQCRICQNVTPFAYDDGQPDSWPAPVCSDECLAVMFTYAAELAQELQASECPLPSAQEEQSSTTLVDTSSLTEIKSEAQDIIGSDAPEG